MNDRQDYRGDVTALEQLSTRQVAARIRHGKLPDLSPGFVRCACHPNVSNFGHTEALRFWGKGDHIMCGVDKSNAPALAVYPALGIAIDTRR